jgi:glycosyltransferase involved in cell wall biosynthesis
MRIMHVGWGFRPWRGGGLISYAEDVMDAQAARGDEVAYFFAGRRYPLMRRPRLHRWRRRGVAMMELLSSPVPVGMDRGTRFPDLDLEEPTTERLFAGALRAFRPDVVHVQELLGLPSAVVDVAKRAGTPVVMTLQDYFPLCPTLKLFDADGRVCRRRDPAPECVRCCRDAPVGNRNIRDVTIAFELQRAGRAAPWARDAVYRALAAVLPSMPSGLPVDARTPVADTEPGSETAYRRRRELNLERLQRIDRLISSSTRTTEIYAELGVPPSRLVTLHLGSGHIAALVPRRIDTPPRPVRFITLAGAQSAEKGAFVVLEAARRLAARPAGEYELHVHGHVDARVRDELERLPAVRLHGPYEPDDLGPILDGADVGLVPSAWEEVLGHVGLECIAKGVPVIVNARGGLLDYAIPGETGWVNRSATGEELAEIMAGVVDRPDEIVRLNRTILDRRDELVKPLERHLPELDAIYAEVIAGGSGGGS